MPFSHTPKSPGDLIKSEDWNEALDAIVDLFNKFSRTAGHRHTGTGEDSPQITDNGIAANAVTTDKIRNRAVTAAKIASGVVPNIGVAVTSSLSDGQNIPVPRGFNRNECVFFAAAHTVNVRRTPATYAVKVDGNGKVTFVMTPDGSVSIGVAGLALGKKGGWG